MLLFKHMHIGHRYDRVRGEEELGDYGQSERSPSMAELNPSSSARDDFGAARGNVRRRSAGAGDDFGV